MERSREYLLNLISKGDKSALVDIVDTMFSKREDVKKIKVTEKKTISSVASINDSVFWDSILSKPTEFPPTDHDHQISDIIGLSERLGSYTHNGFSDLQGGISGEYFHLSSAQYTTVSSLTGWATKAYTNGSTTDVAEGSNLYYTDDRANARVSAYASSTTPAALGTAAVGTGTTWARADHVHAMPTAAQVGAEPALGNPSVSGYILSSTAAGVRSWIAPAVGTVTSVGLTAPALMTASGSPVTGSGTLVLTWSGSSANLVRADGSTVASSSFQAAGSYQPLHSNLTTIAALSTSGTGVIQMTAGVASLVKLSATAPIIYSAGAISHSAADGYLHVPATSTTNSGKALIAGATAGSISWTRLTTSHVSGLTGWATKAYTNGSTTDVTEGANLYYTDARADARITLQKGVANGIASLGSDGKVPLAQLPATTIVDTFVVASQTAMLALTAQQGDVCVRTDLSKTFILKTEPASTLANWQEMLSPSDGVQNVAMTVSGPLSVSGSPITSTGTLGITWSGSSSNLVRADGSVVASSAFQPAGSYQTLNSILTSISGLSTATTGLIKLTNGVASLDTTSYLSTSGTAASATKLATGRTIGITGDATWTSPAFDGTANVTAALTLSSVITAGGPIGSSSVVPVITYDAKGRLTAVTTATITPASIGAQAALTNPVTGTAAAGQVAYWSTTSGIAGSANFVFDGTKTLNVGVSSSATSLNPRINILQYTGQAGGGELYISAAGTASDENSAKVILHGGHRLLGMTTSEFKLQRWNSTSSTWATVLGSTVTNNASLDVTFYGVVTAGSGFAGNASTATKLAAARTLTIGSTGRAFDGSANVSWTLAEIGAQAALGYTPINKGGDTGIGSLNLSNGSRISASKDVLPTTAANTNWSTAPLVVGREATSGTSLAAGIGFVNWNVNAAFLYYDPANNEFRYNRSLASPLVTIWDSANLPVTTFAKSILDDADAAAVRTTIGAVGTEDARQKTIGTGFYSVDTSSTPVLVCAPIAVSGVFAAPTTGRNALRYRFRATFESNPGTVTIDLRRNGTSIASLSGVCAAGGGIDVEYQFTKTTSTNSQLGPVSVKIGTASWVQSFSAVTLDSNIDNTLSIYLSTTNSSVGNPFCWSLEAI